MKSGKCKFCEAPIHGRSVACLGCRELFNLVRRVRTLKRKMSRIACRRVLMEVKIIEVLEKLNR